MIKNNLSRIKIEKVLEYEVRHGVKKVVLERTPSCQSKLYFYNEKAVLTKEFNEDHLVKSDYTNGENENLNYKSNSRLKMVEIFTICKSKIEEANDKKLFHIME